MTVSSSSAGSRPGICTTSNRPLAPYEGQIIYETDSDSGLIWNGTEWAEIFGSRRQAMHVLPMSPGNTYQPPSTNGASTPSLNRLYAMPIFVNRAMTATSLSAYMGGASAATFRYGLYDANNDGRPGNLIVDAGTAAAAGTNSRPTITISTFLKVGWYFTAICMQSGSVSLVEAGNFSSSFTQRLASTSSTGNTAHGYWVDGVTGAFASSYTWTSGNSNMFFCSVGF